MADVLGLLLAGLAAGDSLGSTSEFCDRAGVLEAYRRHAARGWPFAQAGGGAFGLAPGAPTDDTELALCLVRSFREHGRFDGDDVARRMVAWLRAGPPDVGGTTRRALAAVAGGTPWYAGGRERWRDDPSYAANGSLMRNGVVPGTAASPHEALRISVLHGIITHYAPLCVLCCAAQSWLIGDALAGGAARRGGGGAWVPHFLAAWEEWRERCGDEHVRGYLADEGVEPALRAAERTLRETPFGLDGFDPFRAEYEGREGSVLLTLQVAVWAAAMSVSDLPFPAPPRLPAEVFERRGPWVLGWVPMIGYDSDTYAATAGPLIAALHGGLPEPLTRGLHALAE
ncbi:MAG TPA: ADP-ribosylglycohydrolase family protein [Longimicrobium sp.]|jgi:ADP-ribosylglycohydrolase